MKKGLFGSIYVCLILVWVAQVYSKPTDGLDAQPILGAKGQVTDGYRVTATTDKKKYLAGEKIKLKITITNMTKTEVNVGFSAGLSDFQVNVSGPNGKKVEYTPYGREVADAIQGGSNVIQYLSQGMERYVKIDVTQYYDMSAPGKYKIICSRDFPRRENVEQYITVVSNPVIVTVRSDKQKRS